MSQLGIIIKRELTADLKTKSFWLATILLPIIFIGFSIFIGFMMKDSDLTRQMANPAAPEPDEMSPLQAIGMLVGVFLSLFLMIYGSQIYNKVKTEKCNRIVEILATCVDGRTMMLAKIISVGIVGIIQIISWIFMAGIIVIGVVVVFNVDIPWHYLSDSRVICGVIYGLTFFLGGYLFYGSLYAAAGALTDKDNENQAYMTILTFILLFSFYIGEFAVNHADNAFVIFCSFFPFTSATIASVNAIAGTVPVWQSVLSLIVLWAFAIITLSLAGKIYTSSLLLKGKKLGPKDLITFLKTK